MPVLPEVASISVSPGLIVPRFSASTTIDSAGRSLTDPVLYRPQKPRHAGGVLAGQTGRLLLRLLVRGRLAALLARLGRLVLRLFFFRFLFFSRGIFLGFLFRGFFLLGGLLLRRLLVGFRLLVVGGLHRLVFLGCGLLLGLFRLLF